ncbi:MAG: methyltransferase domain-containing protein [Actinomycetia bacterium]|nr:methyltransferase domain-containing protein [Actinomycetes bacterium]
MSLENLRGNWDGLGRTDPLWAILFSPDRHGGRWAGDENEFFASGQEAVSEVVAVLQRLAALPTSLDRALDFGCGAGRLTQGLASVASRVDGVDVAASMIELAEQYNRHPDRVRYHLNEAADLGLFPSDTFDLILSIIVLQHIPNDLKKRYLAEFVRVLRPGGVAAFTVPSHGDLSFEGLVRRLPNSWQNVYRRRKYGYKYVMEFHPLRRRKVEETIRDAGGTILHVEREHMAGPRFTSYLYIVGKPS